MPFFIDIKMTINASHKTADLDLNVLKPASETTFAADPAVAG